MARKYDVRATVTISTTIEPQGYLDEPNIDGVLEFGAESFTGYGQDLEESCEISLVFESDEDPENVQSQIESELSGSLSYSGDDIEWEVTDVTVDSCELQELDIQSALTICRSWLSERPQIFHENHVELVEAFEIVFDAAANA